MNLLLWALLTAVLAVAFWIGLLAKQLNERFDQIEHKLDIIIDAVER